MPRLMSVAMTEQAVVERRKTVTRRLGWRNAKPGDRLTLVRKAMGRRRKSPDGCCYLEPLVRLAEVEITGVRRERLDALTDRMLWPHPDYGRIEVELEGFPGLLPALFVERYFVTAEGCAPDLVVTRIEWRYVDDATVTRPLATVSNSP